MSDVMLFGVLRMPYEMAMGSELSRRQFYARAQEAVDRLEAAERDAARFRALEHWYTAANFHPQEMDLGEGVALIFMLPAGSSVSGHLGKTIDAATQEGEE